MKKVFRKTKLIAGYCPDGCYRYAGTKAPQDMDRFIDALMKKMTVEERKSVS